MTVDADFELDDMLTSIIVQIDEDSAGRRWESLNQLSDYVYGVLKHKVYMIVLDDVHDLKVVDHLESYALPSQNNGSILLITSHLDEALSPPTMCCIWNPTPSSSSNNSGLSC